MSASSVKGLRQNLLHVHEFLCRCDFNIRKLRGYTRKWNKLDVALKEPRTVINSILFSARISRAQMPIFGYLCTVIYFKGNAQKKDWQLCTFALLFLLMLTILRGI
jgi:hypothetical protein